MMDNPICCPPRVDRFLVSAKVKPEGVNKPRKTVKETREQEHRMVTCLGNGERIDFDI